MYIFYGVHYVYTHLEFTFQNVGIVKQTNRALIHNITFVFTFEHFIVCFPSILSTFANDAKTLCSNDSDL